MKFSGERKTTGNMAEHVTCQTYRFLSFRFLELFTGIMRAAQAPVFKLPRHHFDVFAPLGRSLHRFSAPKFHPIGGGVGVGPKFYEFLVHGQVTIIFVVSVGLSVCLCRVFLSRL